MNKLTYSAIALLMMTGCLQEGWLTEEKSLINDGLPLMHVYTVNNPEEEKVLRDSCSTISDEMLLSEEYDRLASRMIATVTDPSQDGVGIAGPQVGISRRIVAVMRCDKVGEPFEVYPNIRITAFYGDKTAGAEGCLSVPGKKADVERYRDIEITYTSPATLRDTTERISGFTAVIFQHECDHLDGILYTDKIVLAPSPKYY